jgi:ribonuclease Z
VSETASSASAARIVLLGVGTGLPDVDRDYTHLVWDGPGGPLLVDAGGATYQKLLRAGIDPTTLTGIVLTHSHCDHINGLPALLFSLYLAGKRDAATPLPVWGLEPTLTTARRLVENAELETIAAPVEWRTISAGDAIPLSAATWTIRTAPTIHSRPCIALRWEESATGRAFVYSADTSPCPEVEELARGADVLIHEATTPGEFASHTSPYQAGEVAARAGVKRLILVHFSPKWTMPEADALAAVKSGGFTGFCEIGRELQSVSIT